MLQWWHKHCLGLLNSKDIKRHQKTSKDIKGHQRTSKDIKRHQKTSKDIKRHQKISKDIKRHQKTSKDVKRHQFIKMKKKMGTLMKYTHVAKYRKTFRLMRQICFNGGIDDA